MAIAAFTDAGGKLESVDEAKSLNDLKKMLDNTTLLTPKEKKDIQSLEKKMGAKAYTKVLTQMFSEETEQLEEANAVEYARKLASYAVKRGGIDKKDFMKIADRMSNAKNDNDMKKIGDMIDGMDTEPRDLIQGSIALIMGPKTYLKMFGDRLTSRDMNQYKKMTPPMMREETLDELKEPFVVVDTAQGNKVVGMASDEKEAQSIISSSELPPMRIKNKKTLKVVKVRKKQMIGRPLKEETLDDEYVITVKGKEVSRHEKESDARSTWHKLRRKHGNDVQVKKEEVELDEGEAYDNDRFLVKGNTAKVDNKNTKDTKDHVYAPNAKTAIAMKKKGVKQFLDTLKMRKQFPTYKEEIELDEVNVDAVGTITSKQMNALKKSYNSLPDRIDPEKAMALAKMLDRFGEGELRQLTHAGIKFISTLAINKLIMKHKYKAKDIHDIRKAK